MSKPNLDDSKRQAALASRRARDKKARDFMEDSYIRQLIRKSLPALGPDFSNLPPELILARKAHLGFKRRLAGTFTPEADAAFQALVDDYLEKTNGKAKREA